MIWSDKALSDLAAIRDYIYRDSPGTARESVLRILRLVENLVEQPGIGRPGRISGTRELVISGSPYMVPYRVKENAIEILSVIHSARKWPEKL